MQETTRRKHNRTTGSWLASRLVILVGFAAFAAALTATPAEASLSCGWITVQRLPYHVEVTRGTVPCSEARSLIKTYGDGGGVPHHSNGSIAEMYSTLPGGWRCKSGAGGAHACAHGTQVVVGIEKIEWERYH